ncbi:MAG TPA: DAK2 domain-containing protein [Solirubrobacteraceae bacterium]|nr:DAK2 domain-containing protein [Solirubrobacteraceae bacterium]
MPEGRQGHESSLSSGSEPPAAPPAGAARQAAGPVAAASQALEPAAANHNNLVRFRAAVAGALAHLESRREEVNDLNVFPVADGDTGDNMALTLRAVLSELDRLQGSDPARTIDEIGREEIVTSVTRAALLGARGNSGVILSQLIRGAAEELVSRPGELIDPTLIGAALANAADRAYASVREPAEGTILTVAREMAHQITHDVAHRSDNPRLGPATESHEQDLAIAETLERAVAAGQESVKRGPELLAALRDAGVVDAGGYALTVIFAGVVAALRGDDPPELDHYAPARITHPQHNSSTYRFCTNFAVTGHELSPGSFIPPLEQLGDSVLVVGDSTTLKVHVHTDEPERATAVFAGAGAVSHLDVADMRIQVSERAERLEHHDGNDLQIAGHAADARVCCGAVAVVNGDGLAAMFRSLGVHTIDGGPTLNPSTYELLAAIHEVPAEEVLVLPNSTNVIMAAERAAELSDKHVQVVASTSQQAGLAAAVALASDRSVQENAAALSEALVGLRTGAVAQAAREDAQGRFQRGDAVGFVDDEMVAWGDPEQTLRKVLTLLAAGDADTAPELISVLAGENAPLELDAIAALLNGDTQAELELRHGGQPAYWWLLTAE